MTAANCDSFRTCLGSIIRIDVAGAFTTSHGTAWAGPGISCVIGSFATAPIGLPLAFSRQQRVYTFSGPKLDYRRHAQRCENKRTKVRRCDLPVTLRSNFGNVSAEG